MNLYPLKFTPIFKEKVWGGTKLRDILNKETPVELIGESWEISGIQNNLSVIRNGKLKGKTLNELIETYKSDFLGNKVFKEFGYDFPLLIKFIDAADDLSVQVHPDNNFAKKTHNENGKNEMWYIVDNLPDAEIIIGFNKTLTKSEYAKAVKDKNLVPFLNRIKVKKGDYFYMPAGRIHAIMKGVLLAEIQQSSDLTYRIFDWNRKDKNGEYRELHTNLALEVIETEKYTQNNKTVDEIKNQSVELFSNSFFTVNKIIADKQKVFEYEHIDSFVIYMCISGGFNVAYKNFAISVKKGETVLIPACIKKIEIIPEKYSEILEVYI
jgi:mannose-6-phosphate isomerase